MKIVEMFKGVIDKLEPTEGLFPSTFSRVDPEKLKTKLKLKDEAESRGKNNLPLEDAVNFDDVEQKIISAVDHEIKSSKDIYCDNYRSYENRINSMSSLGYKGEFESIVSAAETDFKTQFHQKRDELHNTRSRVALFDEYLKKFKKENDITRPAIYPEGRYQAYGIAAFLMIFETGLGGSFFAEGDALGLTGGFFKAGIPSFLNTIFSFFLANYGFRLISNKNFLRKSIGALVCFVATALIVSVNLFVTHFRSAVMAMSDSPESAAMKSFYDSPFLLQDANSLLLLLLGIVCALIATRGFWKQDDPYFSYGEIDREHKKKMDDYTDMKSSALEELEIDRNRKLNDLKVKLNQITNRYKETQSILDAQKRIKNLYLEHLDHLEGVGNILLKYYQNINISQRSEKYPKYSNQEWKIEKVLPIESAIDFGKVLESFRVDSDGAQISYARCADLINKAYGEVSTYYQTIDQLKLES